MRRAYLLTLVLFIAVILPAQQQGIPPSQLAPTATGGTVNLSGNLAIGSGTITTGQCTITAKTISGVATYQLSCPLAGLSPVAYSGDYNALINKPNLQTVQIQASTPPIGGGALLAGQCASGTVAISGAQVGQMAFANPVSDPAPDANTHFFWYATVTSSGVVTTKVCAMVNGTPIATVYNVTVSGFAPLLNMSNPPPATTQGSAYSYALSAIGGTSPYFWTVVSGALPTGVSLSQGGVFSGQATAAGTFNFSVQLTDSSLPIAQSVTTAYTITVAANATLAIATGALPGATQNAIYNPFQLQATGGTAPYTWSINADALNLAGQGAACVGLTLTAGGVIAGTPTVTGTCTATYKVTDNVAATATASLSIVVAAGTVPIAYVQSAGKSTCTGTSCAQAFSVNPTSGNLLVVGIGCASGTVISSVTDTQLNTFTQAATAAGDSVYYAQNITGGADTVTINNSPSGNCFMLYVHEYSGIVTSNALDVTATASGTGTAINSGSATTTQANELIFGYAGVGGFVSAPGANFTQRQTTGGNMSEDQILGSISTIAATFTQNASNTWNAIMATFKGIGQPATLTVTTSSPLPTGQVANAYNTVLNAAGGTGHYTWSLATGSNPLPPGLSISSTGQITGTPTTSGTYTFTVQVQDF